MPDIELHERYPESRREDITDAFMRGYDEGRRVTDAKLRALGKALFEYATDTALNAINGPEQTKRFIREGADLAHRARALGCEVFDYERD